MPKLCVAATDRLWRSIDDWHQEHPCPETGSKQRLVHKWILSAANWCRRFRVSKEQAVDWIKANMSRKPKTPREVEDQVELAYGSPVNGRSKPKAPEPRYDPQKLERIANRIDVAVTPEWLEDRSRLTCWNRTPAGFLHALYEPGEKIVVFDVFKSQGCDVWEHPGETGNLTSLNHLQKDCFGAWFLAAPVTGEWIELDRLKSEHNPTGRTRRAEENVTAFRYAVIESDKAPKDLWLRALVQLPLPIASITDSGDCSIHALIRVDASDKDEWDRIVRKELAPLIVPIGADIGAMTAIRLTRLPNCIRGQTGRLQQLLYLDPDPDSEPIIDKPLREAPGAVWGRLERALRSWQGGDVDQSEIKDAGAAQ
jgi:hypothetical protein